MSGKRGKQVPLAEFRRMWDDMSLSMTEIGSRLGISPQAAALRGKKRGFPLRGYPSEKMQKVTNCDFEMFRRMWDAGVHSKYIAAHFGIATNSVRHYRRRFGLKSRGHGGRIKTITIDDFWAIEAEHRAIAVMQNDPAAGKRKWERAA